ncbi:MAG: SMC-Scp complex subunit ScpB [Bacillota bacterium]
MNVDQRKAAIESILFAAGDPVSLEELRRVLNLTKLEVELLLSDMAREFEQEQRGILLFLTPESVQLTSNPLYASSVMEYLQPTQQKSISQAMLETLSIIAYKQPVTRADIEAIRGVRCEYSVGQLLKQGLIRELGRKDAVGRPMLFGTTDSFLRLFGLHSLSELPKLNELDEVEAELQ